MHAIAVPSSPAEPPDGRGDGVRSPVPRAGRAASAGAGLSCPPLPLLLLLLFLAACAPCAARANDAVRKVRDFEDAQANWETDAGAPLELRRVDRDHGRSLAVPVAFPEPLTIWRAEPEGRSRLASWNRHGDEPATVIRTLRYSVYVPPDFPADRRLQTRLVLKTKDGHWWDALGRHVRGGRLTETATALRHGWNTIEVDLSHDSAAFTPRGHRMRWSRFQLTRISAVGFAFHADGAYAGTLGLDDIVTWTATDDPADPDPDNPFREPLRLVDFDPGAATVQQYETLTLAFGVNRPLLNPFHAGEIQIDATVFPPGREAIRRVPAFYYQDFLRERGDDGAVVPTPDRYVPVGPGGFRIRFTPRGAGTYRYRIEVRYRSPVSGHEERMTGSERGFEVLPGEAPGFIRISERDPRYFAFENGDFFYPHGHNFRSPADPRHYRMILKKHYPGHRQPPDRGLRIYEEALPRMAAAGVNCFEVWMASWWLGLEWTSAWPGYHGLGVYNMENAWKLDRLLELAGRHGQYVHLVIDNHGKAAQDMPGQKGQVDHEWEFSPYNAENAADGGFLEMAIGLFSDERAKDYYRDKLRYIAARWGADPRIFGVELWSELDLIGHIRGSRKEIYQSPAVRSWHEEMSAWFREHDHGRHPITTHYSGYYTNVDHVLVAEPFIDYITCDAYHKPEESLLNLLDRTERGLGVYGKPYLVTEYGGNWNASSEERLRGDLVAGMWHAWFSRQAGTPLFWWFEYIALADLYPHYAGLAAYIRGEDKRRGGGTGGEPDVDYSLQLSGGGGGGLEIRGRTDGRTTWAWVYEPEALRHLPLRMESRPRYEGVSLILPRRAPVTHEVEVWDPWTGEIVETRQRSPDGQGTLRVELPPFVVHAAVKVRATGGASVRPPRNP
jgi:hypothetical protein